MTVAISVVQALRKSQEQLALWAQGRLKVTDVNALRLAVGWAKISAADNNKVTDAKPGHSWHEFGLAVDIGPDDESTTILDIDWNEAHPVWQEMIQKGEALGLTSGKAWNDMPHFQLTGRFGVSPDDEVRAIYHNGGLQAVWQAAGISA